MDDLITAVRAVAGDDEEPYLFTDEQIDGILLAADESVTLAAAILIERVAQDQALLYKYLRTDDLTVSGHQTAQVLLNRAQMLREQAGSEGLAELDESFTIVYPTPRRERDEYTRTQWVPWL